MNRTLVYEYKNDWKIDVSLCKNYKRIGSFSPIPNADILFDFQAWYEVISPNDEKHSLSVFRLKLEKLYSFNIQPSLELDISVKLKYNSMYNNIPWHAPSCTFSEYNTVSFINVEKMDRIEFDNVVHKMYNGCDKSAHNKNMDSKILVLLCNLKFYLNIRLSDICRQKISCLDTFVDGFKCLFKSSQLSDISFKIGEKSIPAHKTILAAHSPVFKTMLTQDFLESTTNCIEIKDCSFGDFENFLKYLYFRKIEDSSYPAVAELHMLSDKYDVSSLKEECARLLRTHININNICDILRSAYDFNNDNLKISTIVFADVHFDDLKSRKDWKALVKSHPEIGYEVVKRFSCKN